MAATMSKIGKLVLLLALAAAAPASAQSVRDEAARALKEARRLHEVRDYETALAKFLEVERLLPASRLDVLVAATLEALGRTVEAAERLERAIRRARRAQDEAQERVARRRLEELWRNVSSVRVSCSVLGATVLLDGRVLGEVPIERRIYLAPGSHRLRVRAHGHETFDRTLVLYPGDHPMVNVELVRSSSRGGARTSASPRPRRRVWTWVVLAAAGATFATAAAIGAWGKSEYDEYKSPTLTGERWDELQRSLPWKERTANALFGVGGALAAAAVVLFFTEARGGTERPRSERRVSLTPAGSGVAFSTSF